MIIVLNTDTTQKLDIDWVDYGILKIIYSSGINGRPCFISQKLLSDYLGLSRQTINNRMRNLEKKGYLITKFQYKKVSGKIKILFEKEKKQVQYIRKKTTEKKREERIKKNDGLIDLFNQVYERIRRK